MTFAVNIAQGGSNNTTFRNRIINGAMVIDQRNNGASVGTSSGTLVYTLDRWAANYSQINRYTVQQNAGSVTPPTGFVNYLGITSSAATSLGASDFFMVNQRIEGFNVADLAWGTASAAPVTLSFLVRSSLTGTFGGVFTNSAQNRSYPFTYSIASANTWEQKTVTVPGDTTGTWLTNNGTGLFVNFGLGVGSTFSGTAGAWSGSNLYSATGATSVVGTNGATFYITGVQLEEGTAASPFEFRQYGTELALCQRYYYRATGLASIATMPRQTPVQAWNAASTSNGYISTPVSMRAAPTFSQSGLILRSPNFGSFSATFSTGSATTEGLNIATSGSSGLSAGGIYYISPNNGTSDFYDLSAEL